MVLAKALVDKEKETGDTRIHDVGHILPTVPLHEARQIMTRADFIQSYDQVIFQPDLLLVDYASNSFSKVNLFTIDSTAMVRAG